jgi:nicotinamidase-related amidase
MARVRRPTVLVDVCTQRDYLCTGGAQPVINADEVRDAIKRLMSWVRWCKLPMLSTVDSFRPQSAGRNEPSYCVVDTPGQHKISYTLLPDRVRLTNDNCICVSLDLLNRHQQAIFTKHHRDPFTNPKFDRLLTEMPVGRFLVFGVSLDLCLRSLVLGLLMRGRRVTLVRDACGYWDQARAEYCIRQIQAKGADVATTDEIIRDSKAGELFISHIRSRKPRSVA